MFTIICVYSNKDTLDQFLLKSLKGQNAEYQVVLVDNVSGTYKSAAGAYNYGGRQATGKYLMFVHQDVDFCSGSWLSDAEMMLDSIGKFGVAGVAGMSEKGRNLKDRGRNVIINHEERCEWEFGHPIEKPEKVQTLDGCLLVAPSEVFRILKFDEKVCDNWHLYDVDYCLSCLERGYDVYVLPKSIYHRSAGPWHHRSRIKILLSLGALPESYYRSLSRLIVKHKNAFRNIYCSNGEWNTYQPVCIQRISVLAKAGFALAVQSTRKIFRKRMV
jgi:GT2 family glycosyltransferase